MEIRLLRRGERKREDKSRILDSLGKISTTVQPTTKIGFRIFDACRFHASHWNLSEGHHRSKVLRPEITFLAVRTQYRNHCMPSISSTKQASLSIVPRLDDGAPHSSTVVFAFFCRELLPFFRRRSFPKSDATRSVVPASHPTRCSRRGSALRCSHVVDERDTDQLPGTPSIRPCSHWYRGWIICFLAIDSPRRNAPA
jgi:hypothetical protein